GPALRYVPVTNTQGPAGARNAGWHTARAELIAFTDDDTQPDPGWLAAGLRAFEQAASSEGAQALGGTQLAAVTGQVVMPLPETPTDYEMDASGLVRAEFVTANCFVAKWALQEVGGFDERFTLAWREDSDLHFSLLSRGYAIHKAADAIVLHPVRPAPPGVSVRQQRKVVFDALLYRKWPQLYRERIRKTPPWHYFIIVASLLVLLAALLAGHGRVAGAAFSVWAVFTLWFCARRLAKTSRRPGHILEMFVTSVLIPPLAVFWRLVGAWRFRTPFI
nr:glycosyltransferase [Pseudomonas sp.]